MSDGLVLDASAAMAWCFLDEATPASAALLDRLQDNGADVPHLWHLEIANVLLAAERRKRIKQAQIADFLGILASARIRTDHEPAFRAHGPIMLLARAHALTIYDATYLDLALRLKAPLATRDAALLRAAQAAKVPLLAA